MTIDMPTKDIPTNPENLSPALGAIMASILMPSQYAKYVEVTVLSINSQLGNQVMRIEK